ncbi:ubiquitin carboxyl-terminal hydrolase 48-like isoform X2 [Corticium candelabrum]|uniref:ubiquitin carboxyl-terminal hydrolase 48-like isoform X2 n=1 Tax=Corticium candelabrum TaxID=121492 RepID=UPI002E2639BC|nr:ubiquitin carboxyl-terminal hydrolase 48-like isoform X2 [Corticium candelabrum]
MAPRNSDMGKKAWSWVKTTEPADVTQEHVITAYRIKWPACKSGFCSKRFGCRGNPNCIQNIGEKFWLGEIADDFWHDLPDPRELKREEKSYVGLQNLGATCYVNTFLQLWFHMPAFRSAVYSWRPEATQLSSGIEEKPETDSQPVDHTVDFAMNGCEVDDLMEVVSNEAQPSQLDVELPEFDLPEFKGNEFSGCCDVCGQLQLIFTLLQYSCRRFISPASFVSVLGLSKHEQQDAQEFCKLFLSLLERKLAVQSSSLAQNAVQELFGGRYSYVTTCAVCQTESSSPSEFLELDLNIQGKSNLQECIQDFLQEEKLEGEDQYYCSQCLRKQNATRQIAMESLPPVLNMQLLRFVFDRATFRKRKLNSYLQFPEELDMAPYLTGYEGNGIMYDLTAVLTHHGPSAHSGHYIAYIYKKDNVSWWKFDDKDVTKLRSKKLQLAADEANYDGSKPRNKPKVLPGHQLSSKAYMLVYTRRADENHQDEVSDLCDSPPYLHESVAVDNNCVEAGIEERLKEIRDLGAKYGAIQEEKRQLFESLACVRDDDQWEWMSFDWLKNYFSRNNCDKPVPSVDLLSVVCKHGSCLHRADPLKIEKLKKVTLKAANQIFDKYGGNVRLNGDARLCLDCVCDECHRIRLMEKITNDHRAITAILKTPCTSASGFWVGKHSLRNWRKMLEKELSREGILSSTEESRDDTQSPEIDQPPVNDDNSIDGRQALGENSASQVSQFAQTSDDTVMERVGGSSDEGNSSQVDEVVLAKESEKDKIVVERFFNHELLCEEHGNFTANESDRRLVPCEVWSCLKEYFPDAPEFPALHLVCKECVQKCHATALEKDKLKDVAVKHKSALSDLYYGKNRPDFNNMKMITTGSDVSLYVVSEDFLDTWRRFVRYPLQNECPQVIDNTSLICPHGGVLVDFAEESSLDENDRFCVVTEREWDILTSLCTSQSHAILLTCDGTTRQPVTIPESCLACVAADKDVRSRLSQMFDNEVVYVRKITDKQAMVLPDPVESEKVSSCQENSENASYPVCVIDDNDDDDDGDDIALEMHQTKKAKIDYPVRRSTRRHVTRGDLKMNVSSHNTLRELKLKIMNKFCVAPFDQTLSLNGCPLEGDDATLEGLGVRPGDTIMLKEDEVVEDESLFQVLPACPAPEEGFKGTGLVGV